MLVPHHENVYIPLQNNKKMNKWTELIAGLLLVIVPIWIAFYSQAWEAWNFWSAAGTFFKGGLFWAIVMIGVLFLLLGISDLKENPKRPVQRPSSPAPVAQMAPVTRKKK